MTIIHHIYLISDSTGETLDRIFMALKAQFQNFKYEVHNFSFTRTENQINKILNEAKKKENSIILYTVVENKLAKHLTIESEKKNKEVVDKLNDEIKDTLKDNIKTLIDIYFYIDQKNKDYLIEKHNWLSTINSKKHELHIPKKLVFPLKNIKEYENIVFPNENEKLCRFLYGETWRIKLKKNTGYRMEIVNNKPKLIRRSFLGRLTRIVKSYF